MVADDTNATYLPLKLTTTGPFGLPAVTPLSPSAWEPSGACERRTVTGVQPSSRPTVKRSMQVSRRKTSHASLVSPGTRFDAFEAKMATRPNMPMPPLMLGPFGGAPSGATEMGNGMARADGAVTTNVSELLVPPPGGGFSTVTTAFVGFSTSAGKMAALTCVALMKVVTRAAPFQYTVAPCTKPVPDTTRSNAGRPASTVAGSRPVRAGGAAAELIVKATAADVPPPGAGLTTVTCAVPAFATSVAEIAAVSCVLLTKVVDRDSPFQYTAEAEMNPEPLAVSVNVAPPAVALVGDSDVSVGKG